MAQEQDDTFGYDDPSSILQRQQDQYDQAQYRATPMQRASNAGLYGVQNLFGGGPAVAHANAVRTQLQTIMAQANEGADPNEDPITAQMRQARAISTGMLGVDPTIALRAQDQLVRLSQARQQQSILNLKTQEAQQTLQQETRKNTIAGNTPQTLQLVQDQGTDEHGLPMGYKAIKTYDLTDPNAGAMARADIQAASDAGSPLIPMTSEQLANSKVQVAATNAQARYQTGMEAAMARIQTAQMAGEKKGQATGNQLMMQNRIMSAADLGSASLTNIASLPFGTRSGYFGTQYGSSPGASLTELSHGILRNALSTQDTQLYNTMVTGMYRNLGMIEQQGGLQGGQQFAEQIRSALQLREGDTPLAVMGKLADARQILDRGTEVYLSSKTADPDVVAKVNAQLSAMHRAVPWTQQDVIAFDRAEQKTPGMTFSQWASNQRLNGAGSDQRAIDVPSTLSTPDLGKDRNGKPAKLVFDANGDPLPNNGVK
jgi:hypothetical protein